MHYIARNELKQQWAMMVDVLAKKAKLPKFENPVEIFITYYHPRQTVDLDNYTPKFIIDGLKNYFGDDNVTRLKRLGWQFVQCEDKSQKKSVVLITELEPDDEQI